MSDWSNLPEDLLFLIVRRLFSGVELLHLRSICSSWRSSVPTAGNIPLPCHSLVNLDLNNHCAFLSRASIYRVALPSSNQGWLIKYDAEDPNYETFRLLNPLTRLPLLRPSDCVDINLLKFTVSEIHPAYAVHNIHSKRVASGFKRVVLGRNNRVLAICCDGKIRYWNGEIWSRLNNQIADFIDIIVHNRTTYALDSLGIMWWISSSLEIARDRPSLDENMGLRERRIVECKGEFYIVDRLLEDNLQKRKPQDYSILIRDDVENTIWEPEEREYYRKTIGFKVYKMNGETVKWDEVESLGEYAFVIATDTCFSVLAREFHGCLQNAIYFAEEEEYDINVFKLEDGSITTMSGYSQSCFEMFVPRFH